MIRHANAQHVQIRVTQTEHIFQLLIEDDGQGFELNDITDHHGLGLRNIQQRARIHGGSVDIQTAPDQGHTPHDYNADFARLILLKVPLITLIA